MNKKSYAPIVLFVYRRLDTLKKVIISIKKNKLYKKTEIYIFSDGYKNLKDKKEVEKVREYLKTIKNFKKKKIFLRKKNIGLAKNIKSGITKVLSFKKKCIVLEDDIVVAENFLSFMNLSLNKFKGEKRIWHINGWNYEIKNIKSNNKDAFYWGGMHCWGWATWQDRWRHYQKNPKKLINDFKKSDIKKFNYDGHYNFWQQVIRNFESKINTWAIFWYATIFKKKGLCVSPMESLTFNIGYDDYATHTLKTYSENNLYDNNKFHKKKMFRFEKNIIENEKIYDQIKNKLKTKKIIDLFSRLLGLKKYILYSSKN